jgi:hypothetical protein
MPGVSGTHARCDVIIAIGELQVQSMMRFMETSTLSSPSGAPTYLGYDNFRK